MAGSPVSLPRFDAPARPVSSRVPRLLLREGILGQACDIDPDDRGASVLHLDRIGGIILDYFFYYSQEEGLGRHPHDLESAEFMLQVFHNPHCPGCEYAIAIQRVIGKAHGLDWYDNTLDIDGWVSLPLTILVEEGKHASCTDRNGDGYYSPGYDVNRRVNDAWGCRDVIRTGSLLTSSYQGWMTKVRRPETLVVPPLPADSLLRGDFLRDHRDLADRPVYTLRPFPAAELARHDPTLFTLLDSKGPADWPEVVPDRDIDKVKHLLMGESFTKSFGVAYRYDGRNGLSLVFPLLLVKNVEEPLTSGWLVNRVYFRFDPDKHDYGWNILYTRSASRWMDPYFSVGVEIDKEREGGHTETNPHFALETGIKFRANLEHTPARFLTFLTDFWGIRLGLKYLGFAEVDKLAFVVEAGAGVW